ncbi:hypothetical protein ACFWJ4_26560 [Kitasatospora sp. NPDC127067]|uniref:hypothetical protein n=1 Tax=Kitasatospora sp. NPDC127067 TaxID=3347126 RepID=UPI00364853C8
MNVITASTYKATLPSVGYLVLHQHGAGGTATLELTRFGQPIGRATVGPGRNATIRANEGTEFQLGAPSSRLHALEWWSIGGVAPWQHHAPLSAGNETGDPPRTAAMPQITTTGSDAEYGTDAAPPLCLEVTTNPDPVRVSPSAGDPHAPTSSAHTTRRCGERQGS